MTNIDGSYTPVYPKPASHGPGWRDVENSFGDRKLECPQIEGIQWRSYAAGCGDRIWVKCPFCKETPALAKASIAKKYAKCACGALFGSNGWAYHWDGQVK